jgi:hypothetical protein
LALPDSHKTQPSRVILLSILVQSKGPTR